MKHLDPYYENELLSKRNCWHKDKQIDYAKMNISIGIDENRILSRGFAINQKNGWIALMTLSQIQILSPNGTNGFISKLIFTFPDKIRLVPPANGRNLSRIRFIEDNIYVFNHEQYEIYHYKLMIDNNGVYQLCFVNIMKEDYFRSSRIVDVDFAENLLIILFDRWVGTYKLLTENKNKAFEWYHAVAFDRKVVKSNSFNVIWYDGNDDENKPKQNKLDGNYYCKSNKNFIYINHSNEIYKIHPTDPSFDGVMRCANDTGKHNDTFCASKHYGLFFVTDGGKILCQSSNENKGSDEILCDLLELDDGFTLPKLSFFTTNNEHDTV